MIHKLATTTIVLFQTCVIASRIPFQSSPGNGQTPLLSTTEEMRVPVLLGVMSNCPDALYCERTFDDVLAQVGPLVDLDVTYIARSAPSFPKLNFG